VDPGKGAAIAACARSQRGLITRRQLIDAGLDPRTIRRWTERGTLIACGARTFLLSSAALDARTEVLAACLDLDAVASHLTAAWMHGRIPRPPMIDVTVTKGRSSRGGTAAARGIRVHSTTSLPADDVIEVDGIPTMSLARTLLGVAALVPREVTQAELIDIVAGVIETRAASLTWLQWLLDERRCRGRNGVAALEEALDARIQVGPTESWLERRMLQLLDAASLPRPAVQRRVARAPGRAARVDLLYERERIVIEVLGYAFHRTPAEIAADTMRANELQLQDLTVLQLTSRTLDQTPDDAIALVHRALRRAARPRRGRTLRPS
jgi:very-short-patch-repair endonuclease